MRRPLGITFVAILQLLTGLGHFAILAAILFAFFFGNISWEHVWDRRTLLPLGYLALGAVVFLAAGYGLWRLREWGRWLALTVAGLAVLVLLISFFDRMRYFYTDIMSSWDLVETVLTLPFFLLLWPIWEAATRFLPEFAYEAQFVARYGIGIAVNALIVRYVLSGRVKQAFGAAS